MSVHTVSAVWKLTGMDSATKLILLKLADHANDDNTCWPSIRRIVRETCLSKTTVCERLREMEAGGLISRRKRGEAATLYTLHLDRWPCDIQKRKWQGGVVPLADHPGSRGVVPLADQGGPAGGPGVVRLADQNHKIQPSGEPPTIGRESSRKDVSDRTSEQIALANMIDLDLLVPEPVKLAWLNWKAYRTDRARKPLGGEKKVPWTERAAEAAARNVTDLCARFGTETTLTCIDKAINRRWLEVYPPKETVSQLKGDHSTKSLDQLTNW